MSRSSPIKALFTSPWAALAFRLYIGSIFVFASMSKVVYPAEFADSIANYQILPYWAVNVFAAVLPWLEMICGVLLLIGVRVKSVALCIGAMLAMFTVAIAINLARGTPIACGCFSSLEDEMSPLTLLRDLAWLAMTAHVFFFDKLFQLERTFVVAFKES